MRRECREHFPCHRGLAIPTCIMACLYCTCCDACHDHLLVVSFEVSGWGNCYYWHMCNPQFYVSGKRPMGVTAALHIKQLYFNHKDTFMSKVLKLGMEQRHCLWYILSFHSEVSPTHFDVHTFSDKLLIRLISNLVDALILGHYRLA